MQSWWITRISTELKGKEFAMGIMFNPPHPGKVLREYFGEMEVSDAAKRLGVSRTALSRILNGRAGISTEMSLRLGEALGMGPEFWSSLQLDYDLWHASRKNRTRVEPFRPPLATEEALTTS
jgi:addiction module HigA family antidote